MALDDAASHPVALKALGFLLDWPDLGRAAKVIETRFSEINGDYYEILTPVAEALATHHPLAATLALRSMVHFALTAARTGRYPHAARHLADCADLAQRIERFGGFETNATYVTRLRRDHGRKTGFWANVA